MFGTKHSKTNRLQKIIEYQTNEEYKIFELKYEKTKLFGNTKYNKVYLVLEVFASAFLTQARIIYIACTSIADARTFD